MGEYQGILSYAIRTSVQAVDFVPGLNCPYNSAGCHSSPSPTALDMGDAEPQTVAAAADALGSLLHGVINTIEQFEASQEDGQAGPVGAARMRTQPSCSWSAGT
eukprot:566271-Rhodomonas_salina.1